MMKARFKNLIPLFALIAMLDSLFPCGSKAQVFTTIHSFTPITNFIDGVTASRPLNNDGCDVNSSLLLSGKTLYGTTGYGTSNGNGTVFSVNTDGTGFTNLYNFTLGTHGGNVLRPTNTDGAYPMGPLLLYQGKLFGAANTGGTFADGTVFSLSTNGAGFTNLHSFTGLDGNSPSGGLVLSGGILYGATESGGVSNFGTLFAINTDGTGFTNLHNFTGTNDGASPSSLIISGNTLYGAASSGGGSTNGTIFAINTDGTGFTNLHNFTGGNVGQNPGATLFLSGSNLYGTAQISATAGNNVIFTLSTNGANFTILYSTTAPQVDGGGVSFSGLILSGSNLIGAFPGSASSAPSFSDGNIFALNINTHAVTNLYRFPNNFGEGNGEASALILSNNTLYGTHPICGATGDGSVFSLSFIPQLKINHLGSNIVLSWPTNVSVFDTSGFTLQSSTNLTSTNWVTVSPSPIVIAGQNTVTNSVLPTQMFYRLRQ